MDATEISGTKADLENALGASLPDAEIVEAYVSGKDTSELAKTKAELAYMSMALDREMEIGRKFQESHDALVASLGEMMGVYWGAGDGDLPEPGCILRARAALTAAKEI